MMLPLVAFVLLVPVCAQEEPAKEKTRGVDDGPYIFHKQDGSLLARWVDDGVVREQSFKKGAPVELPAFEDLLGKKLSTAPRKPDKALWDLPEKMVVISDVEGEYKNLVRFLRGNGVIDKKGRWSFGKGHLVCVGDFVDRGKKVTEVLWLIYRLEVEAAAAGGRVHMILGNHEVMLMTGDIRYVHPKYHESARLLGLTVPQLVGADTVLGRWLRSRSTLVRIGDMVFVHAGIAPWLAQSKVRYEAINAAIRKLLVRSNGKTDDARLAALLWSRYGPLWYRGYFAKHAADFGPKPSLKQMDTILEALGGKSIVIGHTKVKTVTEIYPGRRVLAIDTSFTKKKRIQGLLRDRNGLRIIDVEGKHTPLKPETEKP